MKNCIKRFASLVLPLLLLFGLATAAFAADSAVSYENGNLLIFKPGSVYTGTDLFDGFKNVMPGDTLTQTITVTNNASDCDYIKLYLKAEPHNDANKLSEGVAATGETVATMQEFLSKLSMKVYNGTKLLFDASPDELDGLENNLLMGTFEKGKSLTLTVELTVPQELDNQYMNRAGEVDWLFTAEAFTNPTPAPTPTPPTLIVTGQLNWPIPVLAILGLAFVTFGCVVFFKKRKNGHA